MLKGYNKGLKLIALLEGTSLLALVGVAVPLKYLAEMPEWVTIIGPIHGVLFLLFFFSLLISFARGKIGLVKTVVGFIASFIPFGTFVYKARCL